MTLSDLSTVIKKRKHKCQKPQIFSLLDKVELKYCVVCASVFQHSFNLFIYESHLYCMYSITS